MAENKYNATILYRNVFSMGYNILKCTFPILNLILYYFLVENKSFFYQEKRKRWIKNHSGRHLQLKAISVDQNQDKKYSLTFTTWIPSFLWQHMECVWKGSSACVSHQGNLPPVSVSAHRNACPATCRQAFFWKMGSGPRNLKWG